MNMKRIIENQKSYSWNKILKEDFHYFTMPSTYVYIGSWERAIMAVPSQTHSEQLINLEVLFERDLYTVKEGGL